MEKATSVKGEFIKSFSYRVRNTVMIMIFVGVYEVTNHDPNLPYSGDR